MEFSSQNSQAQVCRRAYIPNNAKDEVKELIGYIKKDGVEENSRRSVCGFRSDLSSERIYGIFQASNWKNDSSSNGKKYYSHEESPKVGQASLKRSIVYDSSIGCCIPLYTRKPGCSRMKLDIIGYGEAENNGIQFEGAPGCAFRAAINSSNIHKNLNQHFSGCSTNIIGQIRDNLGRLSLETGNKVSKVNKSSVHIENEFYMPEEGSSYENNVKIKHSSGKNFNGSHLTFSDGFLTSIS
ncbi:hypothetical protein OIY81_454 [Cryptosporidium canis]|uniref:Uncharacterized protein n=1 Tax=Cryptosporidium canis TaxID=195482 RepID=A0ABQ8PAL0_9CRYT|nr:hypothetical protein OIY81_454 [Cryptosporidium canis]KAJ1614508.1 hypothetical protein OJ252_630 [Cryptosporidium canis]